MYVNHLIQYRKLFFISISLKSIEIDIHTHKQYSFHIPRGWLRFGIYSHTPRVVGVFFVRPKHQETVNASSCVWQNIQQQTARMHVFIPTKRWNARWRHKNQMASWWFQTFFYFHHYLGKISILTHIFQMGWNHQLDAVSIDFVVLGWCLDPDSNPMGFFTLGKF